MLERIKKRGKNGLDSTVEDTKTKGKGIKSGMDDKRKRGNVKVRRRTDAALGFQSLQVYNI